jgi:hypothetical protein
MLLSRIVCARQIKRRQAIEIIQAKRALAKQHSALRSEKVVHKDKLVAMAYQELEEERLLDERSQEFGHEAAARLQRQETYDRELSDYRDKKQTLRKRGVRRTGDTMKKR